MLHYSQRHYILCSAVRLQCAHTESPQMEQKKGKCFKTFRHFYGSSFTVVLLYLLSRVETNGLLLGIWETVRCVATYGPNGGRWMCSG